MGVGAKCCHQLQIFPPNLFNMAVNDNNTVDETTTLLASKPRKWAKSVLYRALFTGFAVAISFGVTQVP